MVKNSAIVSGALLALEALVAYISTLLIVHCTKLPTRMTTMKSFFRDTVCSELRNLAMTSGKREI